MKSPPLSPRLSIYAWHPGAAASIAHRMTGILMVLCIPLYLWLISSMTGSAEDFRHAQAMLHAPLGKIFLWIVGLALAFHLFNGIRFLLLDAGWGEKRGTMRRSAQAMFALSALMALYLAAFLW